MVVLRGAPGTGRTTTALRLLDEVATQGVARFGPEANLRTLPDAELQPGFGYLLELVPGWASGIPQAVDADRLCTQLSERGCFMVIVVPHDLRYRTAFGDYVTDCPSPDPQQVLHLLIELESQRSPELESALKQLTTTGKSQVAGPIKLPSEARWTAALMVSHASGQITAEQMAAQRDECLSEFVSDWFESLANIPPSAAADEQVKLATFRIALAVFNETPFEFIAEAGERLAHQILTAASPRRAPGRAVFANHRDDYLADSHAHLIPGTTTFMKSSAPSIFAQYVDDRMPVAVLRHVWDVHNIRGPMTSWLQALSQDPRPYVFMRAALALGLLASWDFSYSFHELIDPWAQASDEQSRRRLVAAIALDAASSGNSDVVPVVTEIVDNWCRKGSAQRRWTAATALGYDLGLRDPDKSLQHLRRVGTWEEGRLAPVASWAVSRIFARGGVEPVLRSVGEWLADERKAVRDLALMAVIRIADLRAADLDEVDITSRATTGLWQHMTERREWPLVIALTDEDPSLLDPIADAVWQMTQSAAAREPTSDVLSSWMRACAKDRTCIRPTGRLLALLGDSDTDRARLLHLVNVLRADRDEPLPADIADRLSTTIQTSSDPSGEED